MARIAIHLVARRSPTWQMHGLRGQLGVVGVNERLIAREFNNESVTWAECRGEGIQPDDVLLDLAGLDGDGARVRVVGIALGRALVEFSVGRFEIAGGYELPCPGGPLPDLEGAVSDGKGVRKLSRRPSPTR